ncbi:MAG TPA: recombinase family protein [Phycisphaerae bacterium]|nr:recombinase family protein [Phycisphaerae bacterium]
MTTTPTTAIGYVRRSTSRQEESLDQQREKLAAFAASKGWTLTKVYEDDAISGSDMQRPGLESLLHHAESDKDVSIVLAWERNRLARPKDPVDGLLLERRLIQAGKRVCYVATGQEADRSFTSGLVGFVEHYQNGDYLRKLSRDTMRGHVARVQKGFRAGGKVPYGYDRLCLAPDGTPKRIIRDLDDGTQVLLSPDTHEVMEHITGEHRYIKPDHECVTLVPSTPERTKAIQRLFTDYLAGTPLRVLRDQLNASGLRTGTRGIFTIGSLHTILRNCAYKGTLAFNRSTLSKWHRYSDGKSIERHSESYEDRPKEDWITVENAWPALIDADTFEKVQVKLTEGGIRRHSCTGRRIHANYLLSNTLTCGICGGPFTGQTSTHTHKNRGKIKTRYYLCATHHKGDYAACPKRFTVRADIVEEKIIHLIQDDLHHLKQDHELCGYIQDELKKLCGHQTDARKGLQARLSELDTQISKLTTHLSILDAQTATTLGLYVKAKTLSDERQQVQSQLESLTATIPELPSPREIARKADEELSHLDTLLATGTLEERRELIHTYVKSTKADPHAKEIEVSFVPALFSRIATGGDCQ